MIDLPEKCCGTCRHMGYVVKQGSAPTFLQAVGLRAMDPPSGRVRSKGACLEPSSMTSPKYPFLVTDMTVCSMWERRDV